MVGMLTISTLAKRSGIPSRTIRYWESLRLLPQASRSHTGYRLFSAETVRGVEFIQKAKSIGLSLAEIAKVLELARTRKNPCLQVSLWAEQKAALLEQQIRFLSALHRRLKKFLRTSSRKLPCPPIAVGEICCLIEELPVPNFLKGGERNAKTVANRTGGISGTRA